jgi:hypothetical protein
MRHKLQVLQASAQVRTSIGVWTGEILADFAPLATILDGLLAHLTSCLMPSGSSLPPAIGARHRRRLQSLPSRLRGLYAQFQAVTPQVPSRRESEFRIGSAAWPNMRAGTTNARDRRRVQSTHGLIFAG